MTYRAAALRDNRAARRLIRAAAAEVASRVEQPDWAELDQRFRAAYDEHDGATAFADHEAHLRDLLLDADVRAYDAGRLDQRVHPGPDLS